MPITAKQLERRQKYIGSSDMAAILGMNPLMSARDVWASKVYELEPGKSSDVQQRGNYLEPALIKFAADKTGLRFMANQYRAKGIFGAQLDAQAYEETGGGRTFLPIAAEAKSTDRWEAWGDEGTDQVPEYVALQVHHQMYVADLDLVYIPVIMPAFGRMILRLYQIPRNESIIQKIITFGTDWWNGHVLTKIPPEAEEAASIEILKRIRREPTTKAEFSPDIITEIEHWETIKKLKKEIESNEKKAFAKIVEALEDTEGADLPDGRIFTYLKQKGADTIDRDKLKNMYPDIYAEVTHENFYRVARIKGGEKA